MSFRISPGVSPCPVHLPLKGDINKPRRSNQGTGTKTTQWQLGTANHP